MTTLDTKALEARVKKVVAETATGGSGLWRSCSGCYETSDGYNVNGNPFSKAFGCIMGAGCHECGGIGAVWDMTDYAAMGEELSRDALSSIPEQGVGVEWPEPTIINPDIAQPTGIPYLDSLIHRVLDAQQDINFAANEQMSQPLADASALMDEVETAIRKFSAAPSHPAAVVEGEASCECCGGPALTWFAPNKLWNLVQGGTEATDDPGGILCPNCFISKAENAGVVPTAWVLDREQLSAHPAAVAVTDEMVERGVVPDAFVIVAVDKGGERPPLFCTGPCTREITDRVLEGWQTQMGKSGWDVRAYALVDRDRVK